MALWSNRILIVLGALGMFITGVLSYTTWQGLEIPCGGHLGCSIVQDSPWAQVGGVSVSYIGFFGYLMLFGLAIARSFASPRMFRSFAWLGFAMAVFGALFSLWLTYVSLAMIGQKCIWCLASLGVILATTIAHAAMLQGDTPESSDTSLGIGLGAATFVLGLGAIALRVQNLEEQIDLSQIFINTEGATLEELLPDEEKTLGNSDAKVTIVEFADINCGACRTAYPRMKRTVARHDGRVRLAFRAFPLMGSPGHETSVAAAAIAEYAAERGMFWKFMDEAMAEANKERIKSHDGLIAIAGEAGLSKGDILTIFQSDDPEHQAVAEKYYERVDKDMDLAFKMSVTSTPTFIFFADGHQPEAVASRNIDKVLGEDPYRSLVGRR